MVVKITQRPVAATSAVSATADEPVDAFHRRLNEIVEHFRAEPATPQRFLELENALHQAAQDVCRRVLEREANRLEADDRRQVPAKVRYRKETYRVNKKTPARIASRFGTITLHSFYYLNVEDGEPGLHPFGCVWAWAPVRPRRQCLSASAPVGGPYAGRGARLVAQNMA